MVPNFYFAQDDEYEIPNVTLVEGRTVWPEGGEKSQL